MWGKSEICLCFVGVIYNENEADMLLIIQPPVIISFVLSSIPIKHKA